MKKPLLAGLIAGALTTALFSSSAQASVELSPSVPQLQPGVWDYVQEHHLRDLPDPNETLAMVQAYANTAPTAEQIPYYRALVQKYPESRHAHERLVSALQSSLQDGHDPHPAKTNVEILQHYLTASKIADSFGQTLYIESIRHYALESSMPEKASEWYDKLLRKNPYNWNLNMTYAELNKALNNPKAELFYLKAISARPEGNLDAHIGYTEYLLDQGRYAEAFRVALLPGEKSDYLDFLHGYALEKMGRGFLAASYYYQAQGFSKDFPFPSRYQIAASPYQTGLHFLD